MDWPAIESEMQRILRLRHTSLRTERSYLGWLRRFRDFTGERPGVNRLGVRSPLDADALAQPTR